MKWQGEYFRQLVIYGSITLYMGGFLKVYYYWSSAYYVFTVTEDEEVIECITTEQNKVRWRFINDFRTIEVIIFFSEMLSLMLYILLCKLYIFAKEKTLTRQQLERADMVDPFYDLLKNSSNDFLASDNTIMMIITLQISKIVISMADMLLDDNRDIDAKWKHLLLFRRILLDLLIFIIYITIIWQGTSPETLFSRSKLLLIGLVAAAETAFVIATYMQYDYGAVIWDWQDDPMQHNFIFIYIMGEVCNYYIFMVFLFYGSFKFKEAIQGQKQVNFEKVLMKPSRATTTLLPQMRQSMRFHSPRAEPRRPPARFTHLSKLPNEQYQSSASVHSKHMVSNVADLGGQHNNCENQQRHNSTTQKVRFPTDHLIETVKSSAR